MKTTENTEKEESQSDSIMFRAQRSTSSSFARNEPKNSLTAPGEIAELAALYDVYGALLKDGHREIFEEYVLDNLSLAEIAASRNITRQGVYDIMNRSRKKLREYDGKLKLMERFGEMDDVLEHMETTLRKCMDDTSKADDSGNAGKSHKSSTDSRSDSSCDARRGIEIVLKDIESIREQIS